MAFPERPTHERLPRPEVPKNIFSAAMQGNRVLPQRYFGIFVEVGAEALSTPDLLNTYFTTSLSSQQAKDKATVATETHRKAGVEKRGRLLRVSPEIAAAYWETEKRKLLAFVYQVLKTVSGEYLNPRQVPGPLERPEEYEAIRAEVDRMLHKDPEVLRELTAIFHALRAGLRDPKIQKKCDAYQEGLAKMGDRKDEDAYDAGIPIRSEVIDMARKTLGIPVTPLNHPMKSLPLRARLLDSISLIAREMILC